MKHSEFNLERAAIQTHQIRLSLEGFRVLVVDDNDDNVRLFSRILHSAGAQIEVARNGREAVDAALFGPFDAIVMDICMPVLDGYEATQLIRSAGYRGPILALTAHMLPDDEDRYLDAGFSHFFRKPIGRFELVQAVVKAVNSPST